jgi:hypothetical protein
MWGSELEETTSQVCVSVVSRHGKELDEPSVNINLHSKVGFLGKRWRNDNIQKEAVNRSMRALATVAITFAAHIRIFSWLS